MFNVIQYLDTISPSHYIIQFHNNQCLETTKRSFNEISSIIKNKKTKKIVKTCLRNLVSTHANWKVDCCCLGCHFPFRFLYFLFFHMKTAKTQQTNKRNPTPKIPNLTRFSSRSCRIPNPSPNPTVRLSTVYSISLPLSSSISIHIFRHLYFALISLFMFTKHLFLSASRKLKAFFGSGGFSIVIKSSFESSLCKCRWDRSRTLLMIATIDSN